MLFNYGVDIMKTMKDVISFVAAKTNVIKVVNMNDGSMQTVIAGPRIDTEAQRGHIAFLKESVVRKDSSRFMNFKGTILLVPKGFFYDASGVQFGYIICDDPKLAMAELIYKFYSHRVETQFNINEDYFAGHEFERSPGVKIGPRVAIDNFCSVGPNSVIANCFIGNNVTIGANCTIGMPGFGFVKNKDSQWIRFPHIGRVVIEDNVHIGSNVTIDRGALGNTILKENCCIDNFVHVAHNVQIGYRTQVANSMIGGSTKIGDDCWIGSGTNFRNGLVMGNNSMTGVGANVVKDVESDIIVTGNPAKKFGDR